MGMMRRDSPPLPDDDGDAPPSLGPRRLSRLGRSTLVTETQTNLSVTVYVVVLRTRISVEEVKELMRERLLRQHPRYRSLVEGDTHFVELPIQDVDLDQHVRVHDLADPDGQEELNGLLGLFNGLPISRAKPLWEVILVRRFRSGSALIFRQHHCLADGSGGAIVMDSISDSPEQWEPRPQGAWYHRLLVALVTFFTLFLSTPFVVYSALLTFISPDRPGPLKPATLLGGRRKVAVSDPVDVDLLRRVSRAHACKINDLALALFTLAFRAQVQRLDPGALRPVWAGIPIDVRVRGELYIGNKFGFGVCRLPLQLEDFNDSVRYIQRGMTFVKEHHIAPIMYYFSVVTCALLPAPVLRALLGSSTGNISLVVSNVAGGNKALVLKGHVADYVYGLVPPPPTVAVGCAVISQRDKAVFTIVIDPASPLDPAEAIRHVAATLRALDPAAVPPPAAAPAAS